MIDDNAAVRAVTCLILEGAGFMVTEASSGAEGIRAFRPQPADLVFCDLFMPDKDGLETIQRLRQEFPGVRILAMSGGGFNGCVDVFRMSQLLGAAAILHKPVTRALAVQTVKQVLQTSLYSQTHGLIPAPLHSA